MSADERNKVLVSEETIKVVTVGIQGPPGAGLSFDDIEGQPAEVGVGGADHGSSLFAARRDHKHQLDIDELDAHVATLQPSGPTTAAIGAETARAEAAEAVNAAAVASEASTRAAADTANASATAAKYTKPGGGIPEADLAAVLTGKIDAASSAAASAVQTVNGHSGASVTVTKGDVGLGSVDNTSDGSKPISTAAQAALYTKAATTYVDAGDTASRARSNHTGTQTASTISDFAPAADARITAQKGQPSGVATLDGSGLVPATQLPSYVDDVLEYANLAAFPTTGDTGKIYVAKDNGLIYRWSGSSYVNISASPGSTDAVPEGSVNKYYTDTRAAAAAPVQSVSGRTGAITLAKSDVGLGNVDNTSDVNKPVSTATQTAITTETTRATTAEALRVLVGGELGGTPASPTLKNIQRVFYVKDYGAVADGTTDDAAAINAAVTAAAATGAPSVVQLMPGVHKHTATINVNANNVTLRGYGRAATTLRAASGIVQINSGGGDPTTATHYSGLRFQDMTLDGGGFSSSMFNMTLGSVSYVSIDNVHFKNLGSGAHAWLFVGVSTNASSAMVSRHFTIDNCVFSDSAAGWEGITLSQVLDVKMTNCVIRDKVNGFGLLNYGSHDVKVIGTEFINTRTGVNGFGMTTFAGCSFQQASVIAQGYNTTFIASTWDGVDNSLANGITFLGYTQSPSESFWDALPANTNVSLKNNRVIGCTFRNGNSAAIKASTFTGADANTYLSCDDLEIIDCSFESSLWQGIDVKARYLKVKDCSAHNNGQLGTSAVKFNYVVAGKKVIFEGNRSYDDQGTPTVQHDYFIDNQYSASLIPSMTIVMADNTLEVGGSPYYYTGTGFTSTQPSNITFQSPIDDASATGKGVVQLAGDLGGTAAAPTTPTAVHVTGAETVAGVKTFSSAPVVPAAAFPESAVANLTADLAAKAPLASPALTGVPTAPTASPGTSTIQVATTAFVGSAISAAATLPATAASLGTVQLTGDFGGTATSPQVTTTHLASALPVAQGGTGSTTQNFVDLSTVQTIGGAKTLSSAVTISVTTNPALSLGTSAAGGYLALGDAFLKKLPGNYFSLGLNGLQGISNLTVGQDTPKTDRNVYVKSNSTSNPTVEFQGMTGQTSALQYWTDAASVLSEVDIRGWLGLLTSTTAPNSPLQVAGAIATALAAKTSGYTLAATNSTVTGDATTAAFSLTLPTAVGITGRQYTVKKIDASANAVTVATTSPQTIDGVTTYPLTGRWKYVTVQSDGANWLVIGNN